MNVQKNEKWKWVKKMIIMHQKQYIICRIIYSKINKREVCYECI